MWSTGKCMGKMLMCCPQRELLTGRVGDRPVLRDDDAVHLDDDARPSTLTKPTSSSSALTMASSPLFFGRGR